MKEIDVYDDNEEKIGFIDGSAFTIANARFDLYNAKGEHAAVAYLDYSRVGFTIADPEGMTVAHLKRNFTDHASREDWDMAIYNLKAVDMRLLKIFSAFIADNGEAF